MAEFDEDVIEKKKSNKKLYVWMTLTFLCIMVFTMAYVASRTYNAAVMAAMPFTAPASGLSSSLFEAQNSEYLENESLPLIYNYGSVPNVCNIPRWKYVSVNNGTILIAPDSSRFIYLTECTNDEVDYTIKTELTPAYMSAADVSKSTLDTYASDRGYYNGYDVIYIAQKLTVTDGNRDRELYVLSYVYPIQNTEKCAIISVAFQGKNDADKNMRVLRLIAGTYREAAPEETNGGME